MAPLTFSPPPGPRGPNSAPRSVPEVTHGRGGVEAGRERCDGLLTTANQEFCSVQCEMAFNGQARAPAGQTGSRMVLR